MFSLLRKKRAQKILSRNAARREAIASTSTRPASKSKTKPVQHQRWIRTDEMTLGMYVAELSVPWEETGFMFQGFTVDSTRLLKQVQEASEYAMVRTSKVAYVSSTSANRYCREELAAV